MRTKDRDSLVTMAQRYGDKRAVAAIRSQLAGHGRDDADADGFGHQVRADGSRCVQAHYAGLADPVEVEVAPPDPARSLPPGHVRVDGVTMPVEAFERREAVEDTRE